MKIKDVLISWDLISAIFIAGILCIIVPQDIPKNFAKDITGIEITVLAIVFSVYFAALAVIISSGDDDFIRFLQQEGDYLAIICTFRFTLVLIFISLIFSIAYYSVLSYQPCLIETKVSRIPLLMVAFTFIYSLFATLNSSLDAITYARYRGEYLKFKE